ncbi:hypothetical protein N8T08_004085 [Aspergillus melleus]|uniref:Uncharacterized protein n=1 Tax=Aspergillus melleus TaxID=138277 RepID=A0ACC3B570_9EURO|nr:hypothetical protein N8T08_004085 [Aspergillus melleus]
MDTSSSITNLFDVKGIVAVITGGGSGLGLFMTRALATNGAKKVYILGRRKDVLNRAASEFKQGNVIPVQCDVTNQDELKAAVQFIEQDTGYINVLIANSGIAGPSGNVPAGANIAQVQEALWKIPMQEFSNTFHVNCTATFYTAIGFLGLLDAGNQNNSYPQGRSQVIAMSGIASFNRRVTAGFAYGASKSATTLMFKILATYLAPYRIRANVLCPGLFPTDLTTGLINGKNAAEEGAFPADQIPAERAGMPQDIMGPLLYLVSRAGAYCNGNCVITDGGRLSVTPATY